MSHKTNKFHKILSSPLIYSTFQKLMKGDKIRKKILKLNVKKINPKILDIGCGLGDSLEYIENPIYFGYDISKTYIEYAKKNIKKKVFFFVEILVKKKLKDYLNLIIFF